MEKTQPGLIFNQDEENLQTLTHTSDVERIEWGKTYDATVPLRFLPFLHVLFIFGLHHIHPT
jgi:hypothetical protein